MASFAVILLAAGKSERFRDREKKPFADLAGRAVWLHSLDRFAARDDVAQIVIAVADEDREVFDRRFRANIAFLSNAKVVRGGAERADSVENALAHVPANVEFVAVHDTARPCLTSEMVDAVFARAVETGAAVLAAHVVDTLKRVTAAGTVAATIPREGLWLVQTPQVFARKLLLDAYAKREKGSAPSDDSALVEALGVPVALVESDPSNFKITTKGDLQLAKAIQSSRPAKKAKGPAHPFTDEEMWR